MTAPRAGVTTDELAKDRDMEEFAFRVFAKLHPHEAYAEWPGRFWRFFRSECPGVTKTEMRRLLREASAARLQRGKA